MSYPFKPYGALWLHHTVHCAEKIVCAHLRAGSASALTGEVGGIIHRVPCTWWLLGLAVSKGAIIGTRWAHSRPGCIDRLRKRYSHLIGSSFLAWKAAWALSRCLITKSADYCMLVNEWVWLRLQVWLLRLEVDLGSVVESELAKKWRYSVLKASIC